MEKYVKPEMDVVELSKDDTILTSSGNANCEVIVSWNVTWEDANGHQYSNSGN